METPTFNFFPNSFFLFEIVRRFFPDGIEHFKEHLLASSVPMHVISKQVNQVYEVYHGGKAITEESNYENLRYQGYWAKTNGCDMSEIELCLLYRTYKKNFSRNDKRLIGINLKGQKHSGSLGYETEPARTFEEHCERQFFEYLSFGVNAAILEGYLLILKKKIEINNGIFEASMIEVEQEKAKNNFDGNSQNPDQGKYFLTFDSLFYNKNDISKCVKALQNVEPAVIDSDFRYLLGRNDKGSFAAWIKVLWTGGYIKTNNGEKLASLLNNQFPRLNLAADGKSLSSTVTRSFNCYFIDFQAQLPNRNNL